MPISLSLPEYFSLFMRVLVGLVLLLFFFWSPSVGVGDASQYVCSARNIHSNGFFPGTWYASGFGYPLLIIGAHHLFGIEWDSAARLISVFAGILLLFLIGDTLSKLFNDRKAFLYTLPFFFTLDFLIHTIFGFIGSVSLAFLFVSLNLWLRLSPSRPSLFSTSLHSFVLGFSFLVRMANIFYLPFFFVEWISRLRSWIVSFLIAFSSIVLFTILSSHNLRDDTSLEYLASSDYISSFIPNLLYYLVQFARDYPIALVFIVFSPIALSSAERKRVFWWVIPPLLAILFFPLGVNQYYLFPIIPFFLYAGFRGMDSFFNRWIPAFSSVIVYAGVLFSILWLLPSFIALSDAVDYHRSLDAGFQYLDSLREEGEPFLLITGREGELFASRWGNTAYCQFGEGPDMIIHPYTVKRLFNGKDMTSEHDGAIAQIQRTVNEGTPILISSSAYEFNQVGWCNTLSCIPLNPSVGEPIFRSGDYSLYLYS